MKFEEVLPLMREGKRAVLNDPNIKDYWYGGVWLVCKSRFPGCFIEDELPVSFGEWLALACLDKDERIAGGKDAWAIPTWAVMSEKWEIVE